MENFNRCILKFYSHSISKAYQKIRKSSIKIERPKISTGNDLTYKKPNEKYSRNIKRIYDNGHDKYKYRKSVDNPEEKNNRGE